MDNQVEKNKSWIKSHPKSTVAGVVLFLAIILAASGDDTTTTPTAKTPVKEAASTEQPIVVTATKLLADYKANEVAADATYKTKLIEVKGTVSTIGKDILDAPYIALTNGEPYSIESVQCMFAKTDEPQLATVTKGQSITLQGRVSGKLGNVLVRECKIVK